MVVFPNTKINIGLNILSKREDGYHNLSSCFYPIPFCDILEVVKADEFNFKSTGIAIPGHESNNLCVKAFHMLQSDHDLGNVNIHLHKVVPIGAGLGGGSADATYTLTALNKLFGLKLPTSQLQEYASRLGSDCPFFVENVPVMATGTGTTFDHSTVNLKGKYLVLVYPDIHISTQEAYSGVTPKEPKTQLKSILETIEITAWPKWVKNDFEDSITSNHPDIAKIKERLYQLEACYASMTGSGSAVFGLFNAEPSLKGLNYPVCWQGWL
ncbi:4-(cytidine 5'-diphospho)-2-C-methyl-D-erythritol kinase [Fulvivirga sp. M361]|uniref:4-(cytidine 5'-diphospho)-2-C-methyl-D-erythritol kinase n=1 Tax=Fulvivirga sp. M361 TaxID=2594266 RepID=UPI00117B9430|nr:4-(cytidine 5'-diphospho)-2-C-methyl-D-erythritol kinase [Fulvivirga sp. M361]TRX55966.1 4-(cytidine 5'-diphospho)-2-C-methyl-D-erythritol kinase [Fulvivirga sp. M361]